MFAVVVAPSLASERQNPGTDPDWIDLNQRELRLARGGGYSAEVYVSLTYWRAGTLGTVTTPTIGVRCARDR